MINKKNYIYNHLKGAYEFCTTPFLFYLCLVSLIGALILDILSIFKWISFPFSFDKSAFISNVCLIWAFIGSVSIYYLEKTDARYFGIRLSSILFYSNTWNFLKRLLILFFIEIILLNIVSTLTLNLTILLLVLAISQLLTMVQCLIFVIFKTSRANILETIKEEFLNVAPSITENSDVYRKLSLAKMICNLNYDDAEEVSILNALFHNIFAQSSVAAEIPVFVYRELANLFWGHPLDQHPREIPLFIKTWYQIDNINMRHGILQSIAINFTPNTYALGISLLKTRADSKDDIIWFIVNILYYSGFEGQEWKMQWIKKVLYDLPFKQKSDHNLYMAIKYWNSVETRANEEMTSNRIENDITDENDRPKNEPIFPINKTYLCNIF